MNALDTFTEPDPLNAGDVNSSYTELKTGPEHLGVTFVKIRRAM